MKKWLKIRVGKINYDKIFFSLAVLSIILLFTGVAILTINERLGELIVFIAGVTAIIVGVYSDTQMMKKMMKVEPSEGDEKYED